MCTIVVTGCNQCVSGLLQGASRAYDALQSSCTALDRKLGRLTEENFSATTAKVLQQMYRTLPITACFMALPVPTTVGLAVIHIVELGPVFTPDTYLKILQGVASIPLIYALQSTAKFVMTKNPLYKEAIVVQLIYAALFRTALYLFTDS